MKTSKKLSRYSRFKYGAAPADGTNYKIILQDKEVITQDISFSPLLTGMVEEYSAEEVSRDYKLYDGFVILPLPICDNESYKSYFNYKKNPENINYNKLLQFISFNNIDLTDDDVKNMNKYSTKLDTINFPFIDNIIRNIIINYNKKNSTINISPEIIFNVHILDNNNDSIYREAYNNYVSPEKKIEFSIKNERYDLTNTFISENYPTYNLCFYAAKYNKSDFLKWARQKNYPWNTYVCDTAAKNGHLEILQWLRGVGRDWKNDGIGQCPISNNICRCIQVSSHREIQNWIYENEPTLCT